MVAPDDDGAIERAAAALAAVAAANDATYQRQRAKGLVRKRAPYCRDQYDAWKQGVVEATGLSRGALRRERCKTKAEAAERGVNRFLLLRERGLLTPFEKQRLEREAKRAAIGGTG